MPAWSQFKIWDATWPCFSQKALDDLGMTPNETCDIFKVSTWPVKETWAWDLRLAWKQLFPIADSRDRPQARQPQLCPGDQHGRDGGLPRRERVRALRCRRARQGGSRLPSQRLARQVLHQNLLLGFTSPFQYQVCGRGCWNPGVGPLSRGGGHCKGCLMSHHVLKTFHPHRCQDQRGHQGEVYILKVSHLGLFMFCVFWTFPKMKTLFCSVLANFCPAPWHW